MPLTPTQQVRSPQPPGNLRRFHFFLADTQTLKKVKKDVPDVSADPTRAKIKSLLVEALSLSKGKHRTRQTHRVLMLTNSATVENQTSPALLADDIERNIFEACGRTITEDYKSKGRLLFLNLKNLKNPELRESVLTGEIAAEVLVRMTSSEMASKDLIRQREASAEWHRKASILGQQEATTDMFRCGRCKERKCSYYQLQIRSADEPMTTFVTCTNCGNRWKMN